MAKVFVSYSRKDIVFAQRLTEAMKKEELDVWIDWEDIPPTVDWREEIRNGIEEVDAFLFLISPDSADSVVCKEELDRALENGKRLIPIVVRDVERGKRPEPLKALNFIYFRENDDFEAAVTKLMTAIQTDYGWVAIHGRLQVKALEWQRNNKENSFLLRGKDLHDAELQLATNSSKEPHPTDLQREFVFESRKTENSQLQSSRLRRTVVAVIGAALVIMMGLAMTGTLNHFIYQPADMEDYWITIPAGKFQMGSENGNEQPIHTVYLDEYQIGKYEVTNRQYAQCVKAEVCRKVPMAENEAMYPVVNIAWDDAKTYCEWVGGRLPSEAEWEKAASWDDKTETKHIYPWGDDQPTSELLNYKGNVGTLTPVGKYPAGLSSFGLYDMAGNAWEWVNDWYDETYYQYSPTSNPLGPETGQEKVVRGGSFWYDDDWVRASSRGGNIPTYTDNTVGIRCSRSLRY